MRQPTQVPSGIYPPIPTFFLDDEELDLVTLQRHIHWLADFPLAGILALGSNGEAMHLNDAERVVVIEASRDALTTAQASGKATGWKLLVGTAGQSTRGTIARCQSAYRAGADVAVVLPPFAFPTQMSAVALREHFLRIADASPIPILIYNMPANTAGIDMSTDLILEMATHDNVVGIKDSGGQVAKLGMIAASAKEDFAILAGSGSFLLPALSVGSTGAIATVANVVPDLICSLYARWNQRTTLAGESLVQHEVALQRLQALITPLNGLVTTGYGVAGLKSALQRNGYGGKPRSPLLPLSEEKQKAIQTEYHQLINFTDKLFGEASIL